jgi:hypothetical protein
MKKAMVTMMLLAGGLFAAPHVRFGVDIGVAAPVAVVRPACPGPGYAWVNGYYAPDGVFVAGYWAPPRCASPRQSGLRRDRCFMATNIFAAKR